MKVPAGRLDRGFLKYRDEFEERALEVLRSGYYCLGPQVSEFEKEFARYTGSEYAVGLASGLDALYLAFRALKIGKGDEVLVQGNTYIASVMGITMNGATPVFIEPDNYYQIDAEKLREKITEKTRAILVVHLYGQVADMEKISKICREYNLKLVEDCAQSHGAKFNGKMTGSFSHVGCFSFYPSKNLGAFGDGGAIVTDNEEIAKEIRMLRNYGSSKRYYFDEVGVNSRLDELQAGLLRVRLSHMDEVTGERCEIAKRYREGIKNPLIMLPSERENTFSVWHQFVVRTKKRDKFKEYLEKHDIGTIIHYPIPPHLSKCYKSFGYVKGDFPITEKMADEVLSLPMFNGLTKEEEDYVIDIINSYEG